MQWKEMCTKGIREDFVVRAMAPDANVAVLCREYGVSRKTGYKWLERYREGGLVALEDTSRR
jgi:putative transposase